jgi:hypothetical protein
MKFGNDGNDDDTIYPSIYKIVHYNEQEKCTGDIYALPKVFADGGKI